jgi:hypothetical protein
MEDLLPRAWNELAMSGCDAVIANFSHRWQGQGLPVI